MRDNGIMIRTRQQEEAWLAQWRGAAGALREQRAKELQELSGERALRAAEAVLALADPARLNPARRYWSGLVEQQALFHRRPA